MTVSTLGQARVFFISVLTGILCVMLYDAFNVLMKRCGKSILIVNLIDIAYFIGVFCLVLYSSVKYNLGAFRYYQLAAIAFGAVFYAPVASRHERRIFEKLFDISIAATKRTAYLLVKPFLFLLRLILTPLLFIEERVIALSGKVHRIREKMGKKRKRNKKTVKKRMKMI